jgi:hypothetical protein
MMGGLASARLGYLRVILPGRAHAASFELT